MSMVVVVTEMSRRAYVDGSQSGYWKCVPVCMLVIHQNVFGR